MLRPRDFLAQSFDRRNLCGSGVSARGRRDTTMAARSNDKPRAAKGQIAARSSTVHLIPAASREWARRKFENFSLSRYSEQSRPANFVSPKHAKNIAVIQKTNKTVMTANIARWPKETQANAGLSLSLADQDLRTLLPSYKSATGTINVEELLSALKAHMTGTQFYSTGSPPLVRLAEQEQIRKSAQQIIRTIKDNAASTKKPPPLAPSKGRRRP